MNKNSITFPLIEQCRSKIAQLNLDKKNIDSDIEQVSNLMARTCREKAKDFFAFYKDKYLMTSDRMTVLHVESYDIDNWTPGVTSIRLYGEGVQIRDLLFITPSPMIEIKNGDTSNIRVIDKETFFTLCGNLNGVMNNNDATSSSNDEVAYVDLGLPSGTLWATCNLGANKPEEYGDFYMWGSVTPNTNTICDWEHTPFNNGSNDYDKSFFNCVKNIVCPDAILSPEYDAATQNLGGKWRMPTYEEWKELVNNTSVTWTQVNGINGRKFTAVNGNSIFIPASGCRGNSGLSGQGSYGYYWSSSLNVGCTRSALNMYFDNGKQHPHFTDYRHYGFSIRPVYKP